MRLVESWLCRVCGVRLMILILLVVWMMVFGIVFCCVMLVIFLIMVFRDLMCCMLIVVIMLMLVFSSLFMFC